MNMIGLSVSVANAPEIAAILDENKMSLNGRKAAAILDRFDRALFPLKGDTDAVLTRMLIADVEPDPIFVDGNMVNRTIKAAERKRPAYDARSAVTARKRFDEIFGSMITKTMRRAAHKGWVTRIEWNERERLGEWSHEWRLQYVFDGHSYIMDGDSVADARAWGQIAKAVKKLAQTHRGARIGSATITLKKNQMVDDVTKRASKAFDRAVR